MDQELVKFLDHRFQSLEQRLDQRFEQVDQRFESTENRFEQIDRKFEGIDRQFAEMHREMNERSEDVKRYFGVLTEDLHRQLQLVAEGLMTHIDVRHAEDRAYNDEHIRENRTIFPLLAKPVTRGQVIVGKFAGCWLACGFALLVFYLFFTLVSGSREHSWNLEATLKAV